MVIDGKTRKKLIDLFRELHVDYRQVVSKRAQCHPNTVSNVLMKGTNNAKVQLELLILAKEVQDAKDQHEEMIRKARAIAKKL